MTKEYEEKILQGNICCRELKCLSCPYYGEHYSYGCVHKLLVDTAELLQEKINKLSIDNPTHL